MPSLKVGGVAPVYRHFPHTVGDVRHTVADAASRVQELAFGIVSRIAHEYFAPQWAFTDRPIDNFVLFLCFLHDYSLLYKNKIVNYPKHSRKVVFCKIIMSRLYTTCDE